MIDAKKLINCILINVVKGLPNNKVEVKLRKDSESQNINISEITDYIKNLIENNK